MTADTETVETVVKSVITLFDPEIIEATIHYAALIGFVGIAGGSFIGVACRAVMSVVHIFDKITK